MKRPKIDLEAAEIHFEKVDPIMAQLLKEVLLHEKKFKLPKRIQSEQYFTHLAGSIVSQQISVKAADAIWKRLEARLGAVTPESINAVSTDDLRACGLSNQKAKYIKKSAKIWHTLPLETFEELDNEAVIAELTKLYGIGRWSAEMFLMFALSRPDVFSYGDWGLLMALKSKYGIKLHWKKKMKTIVEAWSPHRTLAALILWHHKDNTPKV